MLDKKSINNRKESLLSEKKRLEQELGELATKEGENEYEAKFEDLGRDEEANAEEVEEYTSKVGVTETLETNLKDVNDALERIENGNYGKCEICQGDINPERLEAYPAARNCMKCSQEQK